MVKVTLCLAVAPSRKIERKYLSISLRQRQYDKALSKHMSKGIGNLLLFSSVCAFCGDESSLFDESGDAASKPVVGVVDQFLDLLK